MYFEAMMNCCNLRGSDHPPVVEAGGCIVYDLRRLDGLDDNVESLTLKSPGLADIPEDALNRFKSLHSLDLSYCAAIKQLPDLRSLTALTKLKLGQGWPRPAHTDTQFAPDPPPGAPDRPSSPSAVWQLPCLSKLTGALGHICGKHGVPQSNRPAGPQTEVGKPWYMGRTGGCQEIRDIPESTRLLTRLVEVNLDYCCNLQQLPTSVSALGALQLLTLDECTSLIELPNSICELSALQTLSMKGCSTISSLPAGIGRLGCLTRLYLCGCRALESLPDSIGHLVCLKDLNVASCSRLAQLPGSFTDLGALETFTFAHTGIKELPETLGELSSLQELDITATLVVTLPESISKLQALTMLYGHECELQVLPEAVCYLPHLQHLQLEYCPDLLALPDAFSYRYSQSLKSIRLTFSQFDRLPASIGYCQSLECLSLRGCKNLVELPDDMGCLTSLRVLDLSSCRSLCMLPESCIELTNLATLWHEGCPAFGELPRSMQHASGFGKIRFALLNSSAKRRAEAVHKLAQQQEPILTTLERMSWLVVLLATATFIAYLQPPGGYDSDGQVRVTDMAACSAGPLLYVAGNHTTGSRAASSMELQQCALFMFFVFDALSFGLSMGCLVTIVMLSMPRIPWSDALAEAGRFYLLLAATWAQMYLAVLTGFVAFVLSGIAVHRQFLPVFLPVVPGMVSVLFAGWFLFIHRLPSLYPGWPALKAACPSKFKFFRVVDDRVEEGQREFWLKWKDYFAGVQNLGTVGAAAAAAASPTAAAAGTPAAAPAATAAGAAAFSPAAAAGAAAPSPAAASPSTAAAVVEMTPLLQSLQSLHEVVSSDGPGYIAVGRAVQ